ncbi:hypothetical protein LUW76_12880 [Actinomadura madurae]|uniref:hypothetical protein n=1 Tax=Actinomadura madurae TaxID=1993 RepID=UPI0020265A3D|nr:hypothetical protein [Actinomadura madurae]URM95136.1 hypothetical protein LUW76_12880 [Actinomadura madurae]
MRPETLQYGRFQSQVRDLPVQPDERLARRRIVLGHINVDGYQSIGAIDHDEVGPIVAVSAQHQRV